MPPTLCSMCADVKLVSERSQHLGMCPNCATKLGVVPLPRPQRPPAPCRGCNHYKFVRAIPREVSGVGVAAPASVTYAYEQFRDGLRGREAAPINPTLGLGSLEMYICKHCGLVDWYCPDPQHIPIGPQYMTEEVDYESQSPYR